MQIGMNLAVLEEWIEQMGLPPGVQSHFVPVRNLLNWLQVCLSVDVRSFCLIQQAAISVCRLYPSSRSLLPPSRLCGVSTLYR